MASDEQVAGTSVSNEEWEAMGEWEAAGRQAVVAGVHAVVQALQALGWEVIDDEDEAKMRAEVYASVRKPMCLLSFQPPELAGRGAAVGILVEHSDRRSQRLHGVDERPRHRGQP